MNRTAILNIVGLSDRHIGYRTPNIMMQREEGQRVFIEPPFPAVTCTAQSDFLTGKTAAEHGIVANGWYNREMAEVQFWKQSNHLVQAPKVWDTLRAENPDFTCAQLFWWYNMYSSADWSVTPRPMYPADGRKEFDIYTQPADIRDDIQRELGPFPFAGFWGPAAGVDTPQGDADCVSRWIAKAAQWIEQKHSPTLSLVYLPHLDYNLQRLGPESDAIGTDLREIDDLVGSLFDFYWRRGVEVFILSEYGITEVDHPIHLNRLFREQGWLATREELGRELLDAGASGVFAVADHQVAHVYVNDPNLAEPARALMKNTPGIHAVLKGDHPRAGDFVAVADEDSWFTYYYWRDDRRAPDFARTVDIHRKPGYDPCELFLDPALCCPKARIAWRLLQKKLGHRMLMDVIPLDASLVKGSHGARPVSRADWPVFIAPKPNWVDGDCLKSTQIHEQIIRAVTG